MKLGYNGMFFWDIVSLSGLIFDAVQLEFPYKWVTHLLFFTKIAFVDEFDSLLLTILQLKRRAFTCYKLFRLFLIVMFASNCLACIFYRIGVETYDFYQVNWMDSIQYAPALESIGLIYLYSLYWSIATMATVAYGDVIPRNPIEVLYAIFVLFAATASFGYTLE